MSQAKIFFYEGSYQFASITTSTENTRETSDQILRTQFAFRWTKKDLWSEVIIEDVAQRYVFDKKSNIAVKGISYNTKNFKRI